MSDFAEVFENDYCGIDVFLENVLSKIFGEYEKGYDVLTSDEDVREKAQAANISKIKHAATFDFFGSELKVFDITVSDEKKLENNRVGIQAVVRQYINQFEGALLVFHHQSVENQEWRLSYIEKRKSAKDTTSAKRYTYLLGKNHPSRTVVERFKYLEEHKDCLTLQDLTDAFSVESLTKEFYNELFAWYTWACKEAEFPAGKADKAKRTKDNNETALIRLITRLMFVWFIKQKDLIPSWIFDEVELDKILVDFDSKSNKSGIYYNAVLQNLFFATLNKAINERAFTNENDRSDQYGVKTFYRDDKKNTFFKISHDEVIAKFHGVPFLNGGLFECLDRLENEQKNNVQIYEDGFSREEGRRAFLPNELFFAEDNDGHEGLIHILNRYNFTVKENTPLEVQVALDPELLGKVFENLLGTYNPETSETARKDSGSFYTPREIVNFMVNSAICAYLKNATGIEETTLSRFVDSVETDFTAEQIKLIQNALNSIKILDPACGSGAFPMGVLNKLVELHLAVDKISAETQSENNLYIKKGQSVNYAPRGSDLDIKAEYLGSGRFNLTVNGKSEKAMFNSADLALYVKEIINEYNKAHGKKTIANLFSQGRIDNGESFNTIKTKREIFQIVDEDSKEIIWQYKTYNVENKFRSYRNDEDSKNISVAGIDDDFEFAKYLYSLKKRIIQDSIFGVDIQPIAVQISKLRFFISLILEQPKNDSAAENYGFAPLPNLETKIVAANSLIGLPKAQEDVLCIKDEALERLEKELLEIRERHFNASSADEKKKYRKQDEAKRKEIIDYLSAQVKVGSNKVLEKALESQIATLEAKIKNLPVVMMDKEQVQADMFDNSPKTLFQVDINKDERDRAKKELAKAKKELESERTKANKSSNEAETEQLKELVNWNLYNQNAVSPFFDAEWMFGAKDGFDIVIGNPPYIQLQKDGGKLATMYENQGFKSFAKTGDIYCLFYEKGYSLLNEKGSLCFITSNKWMRAGYGEKLRDFFSKNVNAKQLIDFAGVKVFDSATVDTNILLFEKGKNEEKTLSCTATALTKDGLSNLSDFVKQNATQCSFTNNDSWVILSPIEQSIKRKIEAVGVPLKDWDISINYGIKTGFNDAFIISGEKRAEILSNCKDDAEKQRTEELIRPILRGRDIKRYEYNFADLYLINTHNGIKEKNIPRIDIKDYPAVKKHLDEYWEKIEKRADQGDTPYNLRNCAYMDEFNKPKIVWKRVGSILRFSYDTKGCLALDSTCFATGGHIKYLVAILNSKFGNYLLQDSPKTGTGDLLISVQAVEPLKIPVPNEKTEKEICSLADFVLADDKTKEAEIDSLVYELYGLNEEEIAFIEGK